MSCVLWAQDLDHCEKGLIFVLVCLFKADVACYMREGFRYLGKLAQGVPMGPSMATRFASLQ